ncbi:hypothetical protein ACFL43_04140 [Thermodesulfobacteriota bacterium]
MEAQLPEQEIDTSYFDESDEDNQEEMYKEADDLIGMEQDSKESKDQNRISMLHDTECTISRCTVKDYNKKLLDKIKEMRKNVHVLTSENENLNRAITEGLTGDKMEDLQIKSIRSPVVQSLKKQTMVVEQQLRIQKNDNVTLVKRIKELEQEQKDFMTSYELDRKYHDKRKQLKTMEEHIDLLLNRENELQIRNHNMEIKIDKIIGAYNEKVRELEIVVQKIKDTKIMLTRKPKFGKEPRVTIKSKKKGLFKVIMKKIFN